MHVIKLILVMAVSLGIVFSSIPNVYADETSELILKLLIKKGVITQKEVNEIKAEIAKKKPKVSKGIEERVAVLEEKSEETGFLSAKGYKIDIKGGAEIEFVDIQEDDDAVALDTTSSPDDSENPRFQVDKVTLRFTVQSVDEIIGFTTELEMDEGDSAFFDDAYVFLKDVELAGATHFLKVGLLNRFIEPKKIFESYPLSGFAWWEDEEFLVNYGGEYNKWLYWRGELARPNELDDKAPTENSQFEMLHDDRRGSLGNTTEIGTSFAGGGGLGIKFNTADWGTDFGKFDILGFGRAGKINDDDISFLQTVAGYTGTDTDDDYIRAGANLTYNWDNFGLRGQFIYSEDGNLDRKGWYVEPYYKISIGWRYLDSITPAVQISWLDVDLTDTTADARTWDREKYTFGAVCQINKNLQWKNEYSINEEDTGGADADNNEFISQLKFSF